MQGDEPSTATNRHTLFKSFQNHQYISCFCYTTVTTTRKSHNSMQNNIKVHTNVGLSSGFHSNCQFNHKLTSSQSTVNRAALRFRTGLSFLFVILTIKNEFETWGYWSLFENVRWYIASVNVKYDSKKRKVCCHHAARNYLPGRSLNLSAHPYFVVVIEARI